VGLVILAGLGVVLSREILRRAQIGSEIANLEQDIGQLESRNDDLEGLISYFQSDTFLELEAREKLNVQRPGEKVIEVHQPDVSSSLVGLAPHPVFVPKNNPERWWVYLFGARES